MTEIVLVDANVLYSRTLRDWLFLLKIESNGAMFTVHASEDILAEVIYRMRRSKPAAPGSLTSGIHDRIEQSLDSRVDDYKIEPGFPPGDPNDEHVHAAAIAAGANILLTADSGFLELPEVTLQSLPYEVYSPDAFFVLVDDSSPDLVRRVTKIQDDYWKHRGVSGTVAEALDKSGCPTFSKRVSARLSLMNR